MMDTTRFSLRWLYMVAWIIALCVYFAEANDCHYDISTDVYPPPVINHTGGECSWNITAPEPYRVALTIDTFRLLSVIIGGDGSEATYQVSDEVGSLGPYLLGQTGTTFHSDFSHLLLTLTITTPLDYVEAELIGTIREVEETYSCDFEDGSVCTREISEKSEWAHDQGIAASCPRTLDSVLTNTGLFYDPAVGPSDEAKLLSRPLERGKYLVELSVVRACAEQQSSSALVLVSFCGQQWNYTVGLSLSGGWRALVFSVECEDDFEATFEAVQTSVDRVVIAADSILISKILEPASPTQLPAVTLSMTTEMDDTDTGSLVILVAAGGGAVAVALILVVVVCIGVCLCRWRSEEPPKPSATTQANNSVTNRTYDVKIPMKLPMPIRRRLSSYDQVKEDHETAPEEPGIATRAKPMPAPRGTVNNGVTVENATYGELGGYDEPPPTSEL